MSDTGWKTLVRTNKYNFLKWGEYMKRAQTAERKLEQAQRLLDKANQYLKEGKAKFTPNTTNSLVDDWLRDYSVFQQAMASHE